MTNYDYVEMRFPASAEYVGLVRLTLSHPEQSRRFI